MKKISIRRRARFSVGIISAFIASGMLVPSVANADQPPFKDSNAVGLIGFCDLNDNPVTSGHIRDVPFVVKYVSNTPAPKDYVGPQQKAAIYAFSPLPNSNPGDWVGFQMTASSGYSNEKTPMAKGTYADAPLEWHTTSFPPQLDGLVQVRMILSNVNTPPRTNQYPQAIVRVKGDSWTLVTGLRDKSLCKAGLAKSAEEVHLPASKLPTAAPSWAANATSGAGGAAPTKGATSPGSVPGSGAPTTSPVASGEADPNMPGAASAEPSAQAASSQTSASGLGAVPWILGLSAVLVGVGAFIMGRKSAGKIPTDPPV
jgi:hypothetical protein